jgi:Cof subfamily protein (haloacid dehalogenase superfamily)
MIITDLDNTLLRNDKTISDYTIAVLKKCQSSGIKIVYATARSMQASKRFFDFFTPDIFIGYGGALAAEGNKTIYRNDIPADISSQIIKQCLAAPEVSSILAINESVALTNDKNFMNDLDISHYHYTDFKTDYKNSYLKISLTCAVPAAVEKIAAHFPMCDLMGYTGEDLYKFARRNAVKWNAVKAISEYYGVGADMIVAFGDDKNDVEMLEKCGTGVAVKNAIREAKTVAKYICDTNENDGVAKWLNEHIVKY